MKFNGRVRNGPAIFFSNYNTEGWGFEAIFDIDCPDCGLKVEFFKDEIRRT
jgi:hypothetical protein